MHATLAAIPLHPETVIRFELGSGEPDKYGRVHLTPRETAFAVGFALTDAGPDVLLLKAAKEGKLHDKEQIRTAVLRILNDEKIETPNILRFFQEYFGYTKATQVFKDQATRRKASLSGNYRPDVLVADTTNLILHILENDRDVLHELLTTNKSFVSTGPALPYWRKNKVGLKKRAIRQGLPAPDTPFADRRNQVFLHPNHSPPVSLPLNYASRIDFIKRP